MWVTKLLISPVKKGFFAQKRPNLAQNLQCPVGGWVGGCGARAVSRKTPIYFMYLFTILYLFIRRLELLGTRAKVEVKQSGQKTKCRAKEK